MAIKKAFAPIVELLESVDPSTTVADILPQVVELTKAKVGAGGGKATKFHRDEDGNVVAIQCYYFKKWMRIDEVDFGVKKGSASGLNNMCKEGVSNWTQQQAQLKKDKEQLLEDVAAGQIDPADLPEALDAIEARAKEIRPTSLPMYETLEEALSGQL